MLIPAFKNVVVLYRLIIMVDQTLLTLELVVRTRHKTNRMLENYKIVNYSIVPHPLLDCQFNKRDELRITSIIKLLSISE